MTFQRATRLEFQYKAVYSEIENREFESGNEQDAVKFPFNGEQAKTLLGRQTAPGTAFYALPVVLDLSDLGDVLTSTVFVDVKALEELPKSPASFDEYSALWVPVDGTSPRFSEVYLKDRNEPQYSKPRAYDRIDRKFIYGWSEVERLANTGLIGVPARVNGRRNLAQGYQRLREFEGMLVESRFREFATDGTESQDSVQQTKVDDLVKRVVRQGTRAGNSIVQDRYTAERTVDEAYDIIDSRHQYLNHDTAVCGPPQDAVEAALTETDEEGARHIDCAGLDPRQGSRYRQYRYLTSGEVAEGLEIPVGYSP